MARVMTSKRENVPFLTALVLLCGLILLASGCSKKAAEEPEAVATSGQGGASESQANNGKRVRASWELQMGRKEWSGALGSASGGEGRWALRMFNPEAVNVMLFVSESEGSGWSTQAGLVVLERGVECSVVSESEGEAFLTRLDAIAPGAVSGSFTGAVRCGNEAPVDINGTFSLPRPVQEERDHG